MCAICGQHGFPRWGVSRTPAGASLRIAIDLPPGQMRSLADALLRMARDAEDDAACAPGGEAA